MPMKTDGPGNKSVRMTSRKYCDLCGELALYDAKTTAGPWGYLCEAHYQEHGIGLGLGRGQRLEYVDAL